MLGKILRVISLFSLLCVVANAEGEVDPFVADPEGGPPAGPDHLCPLENLDDGWWKSYQAKLKAKLELGDFAFARMVSCPSFEGESVVLIHGQEKDQDPEKTGRFTVTSRIAQTSIWYSLPDNNDEKKDKEVKITVSTAPMEKDLALRLIRLWTRMLERTRPPDRDMKGLDGITLEFSVPGKAGETWSPDSRMSPGMFADLGSALQDYAKSPEKERAPLMKEIEEKAAALEKNLDKHPAKK